MMESHGRYIQAEHDISILRSNLASLNAQDSALRYVPSLLRLLMSKLNSSLFTNFLDGGDGFESIACTVFQRESRVYPTCFFDSTLRFVLHWLEN